MCGRFYVDEEVFGEIRKLCREITAAQPPAGDVHPAEPAWILRAARTGKETGQRPEVWPAVWGYRSSRGKQVIFNARSETVKERPMFRNDYETHRCVIPVSGFYEWKKGKEKEKYIFYQKNRPLYLAGICRPAPGEDRFTVLTTEANGSMRPVHDRMPVLLEKEEILPWLYQWEAAEEIRLRVPGELERKSGGSRAEYEQLSLFPEQEENQKQMEE